MNDKELYEMIHILLSMPKEVYLKCKRDLLNDELYEGHKSTDFLKQLFASVEQKRPDF